MMKKITLQFNFGLVFAAQNSSRNIYQGNTHSEYARALNIQSLQRVLNMVDYAYVYICLNMPKSAWMAFVLHVPIAIPCLVECKVTYFNKVSSLKEHEAVSLKR